jgi:hypothetical protein
MPSPEFPHSSSTESQDSWKGNRIERAIKKITKPHEEAVRDRTGTFDEMMEATLPREFRESRCLFWGVIQILKWNKAMNFEGSERCLKFEEIRICI